MGEGKLGERLMRFLEVLDGVARGGYGLFAPLGYQFGLGGAR